MEEIIQDLTDLDKNSYLDWNHENPNEYSAQFEADKQNVNFHHGIGGITIQKGSLDLPL